MASTVERLCQSHMSKPPRRGPPSSIHCRDAGNRDRAELRRRAFAIGAAGAAMASGAMTLYWTLDGTALLDTVGGSVEAAARRRDTTAITVGVLTLVAKLVGGALALALLEPARLRHGGRLMTLARIAGASLVVYGTVNVVGAALGLAGVAGEDTDRKALWGHALVWDPWFVLWGALLWLAARKPPRG